mmetsp:Transcript_57357/g.129330  ORF Transcript_57357/g.129330 Transcript_57357/m.129330 type:complete len:370 (-) Transcript_57357:244-1353(-)
MPSKKESDYGSLRLLDDGNAGGKGSPSTLTVHLALVTAYVCWGGGAIVGKFGVHGTNPVIFEFWREAVIIVLLLALRCVSSFRVLIDMEDVPRMVLGGLAYFVNQLFWFIGIKINDPVIGSTWQAFLPILTAFISVCLGQEQLRCEKIAGIAVAAAGAAFMVIFDSRRAHTANSHGSATLITGHLLFFANILGNSAYFLLLGKLGKKYSALTNVMWSNIVSGSAMAGVGAFLHMRMGRSLLNVLCSNDAAVIHNKCSHSFMLADDMYWPLAYEVIFCSIVALTLLNWANQHTDASVVTVYSAVHTMATTLISAVLVALLGVQRASHWGLRMPGAGTAGAAPIILGLVIVFRYDEDRNRPKPVSKEISRV